MIASQNMKNVYLAPKYETSFLIRKFMSRSCYKFKNIPSYVKHSPFASFWKRRIFRRHLQRRPRMSCSPQKSMNLMLVPANPFPSWCQRGVIDQVGCLVTFSTENSLPAHQWRFAFGLQRRHLGTAGAYLFLNSAFDFDRVWLSGFRNTCDQRESLETASLNEKS